MILAKKKVPAGFSSVGSLTSLHFSFAMMRAGSIENEMEMELGERDWLWILEVQCHCPSAFNFVRYCFKFRKFCTRKIAVSRKSEGARLGIFQVNETSA